MDVRRAMPFGRVGPLRRVLSRRRAFERSLAARWLAVVVALVVAVVAGVAVVIRSDVGAAPSGPTASADAAVREAVARTVAAGSARIEATYEPARGPTVRVRGVTSFVGPESEVFASVGDGPPAVVRVTAGGAWLQAPSAATWTPVALDDLAGAAAARGWADVLRGLDASAEVRTDRLGRIVRMRLPRDRLGGRLDVRLSEFGTAIEVAVPP